jgi:hypothetical protein
MAARETVRARGGGAGPQSARPLDAAPPPTPDLEPPPPAAAVAPQPREKKPLSSFFKRAN